MIKKDKFGATMGSLDALVNSVLTKKTQSAAKIREAVGCQTSLVNYLERLVVKGKLAKTAKGYKLK